MKSILSLILGCGLGFAAHHAFDGAPPLAEKPTTAEHWRVVERHNAFVRDPANYEPDPTTGLSRASPPPGFETSLAALVADGELRHIDLVFPTVPESREANEYWIKYCWRHSEIVNATGNPTYTGYTLAGKQPLHLNLWFRDSDKAVVQALIRELEDQFGE